MRRYLIGVAVRRLPIDRFFTALMFSRIIKPPAAARDEIIPRPQIFEKITRVRVRQYRAKLSAISDTGGEDAASIDPGGVLAAGTKPGILTAKTQRAQREKRNHSVL